MRLAVGPDGLDQYDRRVCLDDMPAGSRLHLDVTACRYPVPEVVRQVTDAMRRGVNVDLDIASVSAYLAWSSALGVSA